MSWTTELSLGAKYVTARLSWKQLKEQRIRTVSIVKINIQLPMFGGIMLLAYKSLEESGSLRPLIAVFLQWREGLFSKPCIMVALLGHWARFNIPEWRRTDASDNENETPSADIPR